MSFFLEECHLCRPLSTFRSGTVVDTLCILQPATCACVCVRASADLGDYGCRLLVEGLTRNRSVHSCDIGFTGDTTGDTVRSPHGEFAAAAEGLICPCTDAGVARVPNIFGGPCIFFVVLVRVVLMLCSRCARVVLALRSCCARVVLALRSRCAHVTGAGHGGCAAGQPPRPR